MVERAGRLLSSPLVYSLASLRFTVWGRMEKLIHEIHDKLRDEFPIFEEIKTLRSPGPGSKPEEVKAWVVLTRDRSQCVHLSTDQIIFFSTRYSTYAAFEERLNFILEILVSKEFMRYIDATNLGIRYVDRVQMSSHETVRDYISEKILPLEVSEFTTVGGMNMAEYSKGDIRLLVRCITHPGFPSVPQDLVSILAVINGEPIFEVSPLTRYQFTIDMDAIQSFQEPFRLSTKESILERLKHLHSVANQYFRHPDVFKDHAFETWQKTSALQEK